MKIVTINYFPEHPFIDEIVSCNGTLERTLKGYLNAYIVLRYFEVKNFYIFSVIFPKFLTFYPKTPKRPNSQSANIANFEAFFLRFQ